MSHVTCHLSPIPTATAMSLPLLTPPLCTVGWFTKAESKNSKISKHKKLLKPFQERFS